MKRRILKNWVITLGIIDKIRDILSTNERLMLECIKDHLNLSIDALEILIKQFNEEREEQKLIFKKKVEDLEKKGDKLVSKLTKMVFGGAVMVPLQNYLLKLIDIFDDILDTIHFLSGEDYRKLYFKRLRSITARDLEQEILEYLKYTKKPLQSLLEMLNLAIDNKWEGIVQTSEKIEALEESGDDMKHQMIENIYRNWDKIREPYFSYLTQYIYMIDEIQDLSEDASNMLLITIQYMHG